MKKILYNGAHAGDLILSESFPQLRKEIEELKGETDLSVVSFIESLEILLTVGDSEQNPIVFL